MGLWPCPFGRLFYRQKAAVAGLWKTALQASNLLPSTHLFVPDRLVFCGPVVGPDCSGNRAGLNPFNLLEPTFSETPELLLAVRGNIPSDLQKAQRVWQDSNLRAWFRKPLLCSTELQTHFRFENSIVKGRSGPGGIRTPGGLSATPV